MVSGLSEFGCHREMIIGDRRLEGDDYQRLEGLDMIILTGLAYRNMNNERDMNIRGWSRRRIGILEIRGSVVSKF